ncbi:MAG: site-specific integrase [Thermodesulfobacteriota bacterium]
MRPIHARTTSKGVDCLPAFAASLLKADLSPKTVRGYRQDVEAFLRWFERSVSHEHPLSKLSTIDVLAYRQHMVNVERLKPATVNRRLQALRRLCRWANQKGILTSDPSRPSGNIAVHLANVPFHN